MSIPTTNPELPLLDVVDPGQIPAISPGKKGVLNHEFGGDVSIARHVAVGGNQAVRGTLKVGHDVIIDGWLAARNIKGPNKGMFYDAATLNEAFPHPMLGWWALVGQSFPAELYMARYDEHRQIVWERTGYVASDGLKLDLDGVKRDLQENHDYITDVDARLQWHIQNEYLPLFNDFQNHKREFGEFKEQTEGHLQRLDTATEELNATTEKIANDLKAHVANEYRPLLERVDDLEGQVKKNTDALASLKEGCSCRRLTDCEIIEATDGVCQHKDPDTDKPKPPQGGTDQPKPDGCSCRSLTDTELLQTLTP